MTTSTRPGLWATIRDAVRGVEHDYTQGSIGYAIVLLSIPMVLEMAMESLFAVTDIFFVAKLGPDAVAAVGLTESVLTIIYAIAMGLSIGVTAMVARRIGEGDPDDASRIAAQGVVLGMGIAAVLGTLGVIFAKDLLIILGATPSVIEVGVNFARLMLGGDVVVMLLFLINGAFRGAGNAAIAMRVLWLANGFNIVLGPCFIFGLGPFPELGVTGAAVATTIGRSTGVLFAVWQLTRPGSRLHVRLPHWRIDWPLLGRLVRVSGAGVLQMLIGTASWIGLVRIVSTFGSVAIAGYTIGMRIIIFALLPAFGVSNAAATMVGQALGAQDPARAERAVWVAARYNAIFLGVIGIGFFLLPQLIVTVFTPVGAVHDYAVDLLRIVAAGFPLYAFGMVVTQAFNGAGDTWTPTVLNFAIFWVWEIPLAYALARPLGMGPHGIFLAITASFCMLTLASVVMFRRGRWKVKVV